MRGLVGFEALRPHDEHARGRSLRGHREQRRPRSPTASREPHELPDRDLETGLLLALLQDDAKNHSSYLTWKETARAAGGRRGPSATTFSFRKERADKLSGAWGRHPLLGRMYLPAYGAGTELVARLRRRHAPEKALPALYGANGLVDASTLSRLLEGQA